MINESPKEPYEYFISLPSQALSDATARIVRVTCLSREVPDLGLERQGAKVQLPVS